jgi:hypothetical protein
MLCPTVIQDLAAADWRHNVQEDFKTTLFHDPDYLVQRVGEQGQVSILALLQNPTEEEAHEGRDREAAGGCTELRHRDQAAEGMSQQVTRQERSHRWP